MKKLFFVLLLLIPVFSKNNCQAQVYPTKREAPLEISRLVYKDLYIKVTYCQPMRKPKEQVFGKRVRYGKIWRVGAQEATEVFFSKPVLIDSTIIEAGHYSLYAIPQEETWTLILNKQVGQWGVYTYKPEFDALRMEVEVETPFTPHEALTIKVTEYIGKIDLILIWGNVQVKMPIKYLEDVQKK